MKPADYLQHLEACTAREGLGASDLRPCQSADIMSVEREVEMSLPDEYVDFLCTVGVGSEYGGLSVWLHMDVTRPGNVIAGSHSLMTEQLQRMKAAGVPVSRYPKGLLVIHDSRDGVVYGFVPTSGSSYKPGVFSWDEETFGLEPVADSFFEFLSFLAADTAAAQ